MEVSLANLTRITDRVERNLDLVVKDAAQTTFESMTTAADGIMRGAPFEEGVVPVWQSDLIQSQIAGLNDSFGATGEGAYVGLIAGMDLGDSITVAFTAEHAPIAEYGLGNRRGRFFVRNSVMEWQANVDRAVAKFR